MIETHFMINYNMHQRFLTQKTYKILSVTCELNNTLFDTLVYADAILFIALHCG